ncbi:signal peptidase II [Pseudochelatococcus sp. B33]
MSPQRAGMLVALATLALDQATKVWVYHVFDIASRGIVEVTPFFNIVLVWNRGVSYGLFQQDTDWGRWLLVGVSLVAAVALAIWALRAKTRLVGVSLGLIVGGAAGNAIDRSIYGAVLDFLHFHTAGFSWYVFNVADAAIVAGVAGLIYDSLVVERRRNASGGDSGESG